MLLIQSVQSSCELAHLRKDLNVLHEQRFCLFIQHPCPLLPTRLHLIRYTLHQTLTLHPIQKPGHRGPSQRLKEPFIQSQASDAVRCSEVLIDEGLA